MSNAEKWESLVREITCAALNEGQANERGQGTNRRTAKRFDASDTLYRAAVCQRRRTWVVAVTAKMLLERRTLDVFQRLATALVVFSDRHRFDLMAAQLEDFRRRTCHRSFVYLSEVASRQNYCRAAKAIPR